MIADLNWNVVFGIAEWKFWEQKKSIIFNLNVDRLVQLNLDTF